MTRKQMELRLDYWRDRLKVVQNDPHLGGEKAIIRAIEDLESRLRAVTRR